GTDFILLLTGRDRIDRRLIETDVAGMPFADALSASLRSQRAIGIASPSASSGEPILAVDADAWFGTVAAAQLISLVIRSSAPMRVTAEGNANDVIAVYVPASSVIDA